MRLNRYISGTLAMLLLPVGVGVAQPANGRFYPGGSDVMSWLSDASRVERSDALYQRDVQGAAFAYRYPYHRIPYSYQAYVTGPPNWTPGYSYPYGYASSWYPYTSWRGLGNEDNAFPNYDYSVYSPIPSVYGAPIEQGYGRAPRHGATYGAASTYGGGRAYTASLTSSVTITSPPGADIYLEGVKVASGDTGAVHNFQTPPLTPDQQYRYQVRAVWSSPEGRPVDQTQAVDFSAGAGVAVRFPTAATATRAMQAIEK